VLTFVSPTRDIVGARYQLHVPMGQGRHWTLSPGFGYSAPSAFTPALPSTYQTTASCWDAMLDFLYHGGCCDDYDFYCGPGVFYSSLTLEDKSTGMADATSDPYRTFGVQLSVGGGIPIGQKLELTGCMVQRAGLSSFDRTNGFLGNDDKFPGITCSAQFGGGLRVRF
jgi:hypothetical protein